jgi:hypothetical protein
LVRVIADAACIEDADFTCPFIDERTVRTTELTDASFERIDSPVGEFANRGRVFDEPGNRTVPWPRSTWWAWTRGISWVVAVASANAHSPGRRVSPSVRRAAARPSSIS